MVAFRYLQITGIFLYVEYAEIIITRTSDGTSIGLLESSKFFLLGQAIFQWTSPNIHPNMGSRIPLSGRFFLRFQISLRHHSDSSSIDPMGCRNLKPAVRKDSLTICQNKKTQQDKLTRTGLQRLFLIHFGFTNFIHFSAFAGYARQPVICGVCPKYSLTVGMTSVILSPQKE